MGSNAPERIIAGAMSGTSADGVDVALTRIRGQGLKMTAELIHHHARPYDADLKKRIFAVRGAGAVSLAELASLARDISLNYAAAVNDALREASLTANDLAAVAAHGQTLFHDPPNTIQWFDPALVAAEVGCPVVSDFRRADCAAGGQGAPLVPFADYILFRHPERNRLLVNFGGIANVTVLKAGCGIEDVVAYDTGPGNCISDFLMREADPNGPGFDERGRLANSGKVIKAVIDAVNEDPYFTLTRPFKPKTTDAPAMIELFQRARAARAPGATLNDLLATACSIAATKIGWAGWYIGEGQPNCELIVSGGGTRNRCIMFFLEEVFGRPIATTDDFGVPSEAKEALAFALLGAATLDGESSNVPSATGAKRAVVLGSITPKP